MSNDDEREDILYYSVNVAGGWVDRASGTGTCCELIRIGGHHGSPYTIQGTTYYSLRWYLTSKTNEALRSLTQDLVDRSVPWPADYVESTSREIIVRTEVQAAEKPQMEHTQEGEATRTDEIVRAATRVFQSLQVGL